MSIKINKVFSSPIILGISAALLIGVLLVGWMSFSGFGEVQISDKEAGRQSLIIEVMNHFEINYTMMMKSYESHKNDMMLKTQRDLFYQSKFTWDFINKNPDEKKRYELIIRLLPLKTGIYRISDDQTIEIPGQNDLAAIALRSDDGFYKISDIIEIGD